MGYICFDGKPIVLSMNSRKGWEYCDDGQSPSIVSREWWEEFVMFGEFVPVK